jgi:hypothetical protein
MESPVLEPPAGEAVSQVPASALLPVPPPRFTGMLPLWYQLAQSLRAAIVGLDRDGSLRLPTGPVRPALRGEPDHGAPGAELWRPRA